MQVVIVRFRVKPAHAAAFVERVRRQASDSLDIEPACRRFDVCLDPSDPTRVCLYEIYDDGPAFEAHLRSSHFAAFDRDTREWLDEKVVERWTLQDDVTSHGAWLAQ